MSQIALVTGAAGSVGKEVVGGLVERSWRVRAFDLPVCDFSAFDGQPAVEVVRGDILDPAALAGIGPVDLAVHLAALLPPASERDRAQTFRVNVRGTAALIEALASTSEAGPHFVLASSVATYGDASGQAPPVRVDQPQRPVDIYGESKVAAERALVASAVPYTILRIAPVSVPAVLEPPEVWPFGAERRVEFIARADAVAALLACAGNAAALNRVFNVAGGPTWQMLGKEYVARLYETLELDPEDARYADEPTWFDWYDTAEGAALLGYQQTPYEGFIRQLQKIVAEEYAS